jgi:hypothetical protein
MVQDIFEKIKNNRGPIGQHAKASHGLKFVKRMLKQQLILVLQLQWEQE